MTPQLHSQPAQAVKELEVLLHRVLFSSQEKRSASTQPRGLDIRVVEARDDFRHIIPSEFAFPIVVVSERCRDTCKHGYGSHEKNVQRNTSADDSFTDECIGSPLELEQIVDYNLIPDALLDGYTCTSTYDHKYHPLPLVLARECMSHVILSSGCGTPVWFLCEPMEPENILMLGVGMTAANKTLMTVTYTECSSPTQFYKMDSIIKRYITLSGGQDHLVASSGYACYSCLGFTADMSVSEEMKEVLPECASTMSIRCEWSGVSSVLMPPSCDSTATIHVKLAVGDKISSVNHLYEDICLLKELTKGLSTGVVQWSEVELTVPLSERVKQLLADDWNWELSPDGVEDRDAQLLNTEPRQNLDFTDRLWLILRDCSCFPELLEALRTIVQSVEENRCGPLMVSSQSTNSLATWIHRKQTQRKVNYQDVKSGSVEQKAGFLEIGGVQALHLMVEIGLEKLQKDYVHAFAGNFCGLVTVDQLSTFLKPRPLTDRLAALERLHIVLQLAAILFNYLHLPAADLRAATRDALAEMEKRENQPCEGFVLKLPVSLIAAVLRADTPDVWQAKLSNRAESASQADTSSSKHSISSLRISKESPCPSLIIQNKRELSSGVKSDNTTNYHCILLQSCLLHDFPDH